MNTIDYIFKSDPGMRVQVPQACDELARRVVDVSEAADLDDFRRCYHEIPCVRDPGVVLLIEDLNGTEAHSQRYKTLQEILYLTACVCATDELRLPTADVEILVHTITRHLRSLRGAASEPTRAASADRHS